MGGGNKMRHSKGSNRSNDKKRGREREEEYKSTRGDAEGGNQWNISMAGNKRFEAFYKAQGFVGDEEWADFMLSLGTSLPACFRINPDYAFVEELKEQLLSFVGKTIVLDGVEIEAVKGMDWCKTAYKLGTDRKSIRKLPGLEGLHKWMMQHTDCGNITRQEAGYYCFVITLLLLWKMISKFRILTFRILIYSIIISHYIICILLIYNAFKSNIYNIHLSIT